MYLLVSVGLIVPVLMMLAGLLYLRITHSPVILSVLVAPLERAINAELPNLSVRIESAMLALSDGGGLEVRLSNVRIADLDGTLVAQAPLAAVEVSTTALLSGTIAPTRIDLIEPRLRLSYVPGKGLSLSFTPQVAAAEREVRDPRQPTKGAAGDGEPRSIDLIQAVREAVVSSRRDTSAGSHLTAFGLKNGTVLLDQSGEQSVWRVLSGQIDLEHRNRRSVIVGSATISSQRGPWTLTLKSEEGDKSGLGLEATFSGLVPRGIARNLPGLSILEAIDTPLSGRVRMSLGGNGLVDAAAIEINVGQGPILLPVPDVLPFAISRGRILANYSAAERKLVIEPSQLEWGSNRIALAGSLVADNVAVSSPSPWTLDLRSLDGVLTAEEFAAPALPIEAFRLRARFSPADDSVTLEELSLRAGGGAVAVVGSLRRAGSDFDMNIEGRIGAMPAPVAKVIWPSSLAPLSRHWFGENVLRGNVQSGSFKIIGPTTRGPPGSKEPQRLLTVETANVEFNAKDGFPPVEAPRILVRVEGTNLEVSVPEASVLAAPGKRLSLKGGRLTATEVDRDRPPGEISVRVQGPLPAVLALLDREPYGFVRKSGLQVQSVDGKFDGQFQVSMPLGDSLMAEEVKVSGKSRITEVRVKDVMGTRDITGATIAIDVSDKSIDASGDFVLAGVNGKVAWQRGLGPDAPRHSALRITADLSANDRHQLGFEVQHLVVGTVPVEVLITPRDEGDPSIHFAANLGPAELIFDNLAWHKPANRPARLEFDIASGRVHKVELQNIKLTGDNIAVDGWVAIGADQKLREFYFPEFTLNLISQLEIKGSLRSDNIWEVTAKGPRYDGRELFRSLFSVGQIVERPVAGRPPPGLSLLAEVDSVIGFGETNLRSVRVAVEKRGDKMIALDARGVLEGGKTFDAVILNNPGQPRMLLVESVDAGAVLKLVGFYPNMAGGHLNLEVNLDGEGAAEKKGVLWVRNFRVLGDAVVGQVLQSVDADKSRPPGGKRPGKQVVRQQIDFDRMKIPFSVGHGQFVMDDASIRGPLEGATLRGRVDFRASRLQLGGTYVPLTGLNTALCEIPVIGQILAGPKCDGVFGLTFAIQGPLNDPQVLVNPLSMFAPGLFRGLFEMTAENPRVVPRDDRGPTSLRGVPRTRSSGDGEFESGSGPRRGLQPDVTGGWSSETTRPQKGDRKK